MWRSTFLFKPVLLYPLVMTSASDLQRKKRIWKGSEKKKYNYKMFVVNLSHKRSFFRDLRSWKYYRNLEYICNKNFEIQ